MRTSPVTTLLCALLQCVLSYRSPSFTNIKRNAVARDMKVMYGWKMVDFVFPSASARRAFIDLGTYIPGNAIILDVDYWQKGKEEKVLVTLPRMKPGVPATLATVSKHKAQGTALLAPYPDWSWHQEEDCDNLISVFRVKIDSCGRLWVLDSGITQVLTAAIQSCPPKVLAFDLHTNKLITKYMLPPDVLEHGSLLVTIEVDVRNSICEETFLYIADVNNYALIVVDMLNVAAWRVHSNYFYPYPTHGDFDIAGHKFDLMDGVIGLALSPIDIYGDRTLFFHSLASVRESKVSTSILRNSSNFEDGVNHVSRKFYVTEEVRTSQSAAEAMSEDGIMFFGLLADISLACWNSRVPYVPPNIVEVAKNTKTLEFPSGIKVVKRNGREEVWAITSKFPQYYANVLDMKQVNYRILVASVDELVRGTNCDTNIANKFKT